MSSLKSIFPNGFPVNIDAPVLPPEHQLRVHMSENCIQAPDDIVCDGKLHRFATGSKKGDLSGWYVLHDGKVPAGVYGDWKTGEEYQFRANIGRELTFQENIAHVKQINELKLKREKELSDSREYAAYTATKIWDAAQLASDDHPYIKRKGISNPGWRIAPDGRLIAPMLIDGDISGLQYISDDGTKMFMKGSKTGGASWNLGSVETTGEGRIYICEGIATGASIFEATGSGVVISFSAGNMPATAQALRHKVGPLREIVIVADNDESGTGKREADKAAGLIGATVIIPPVPGDANDYAQAGHDLGEFLEPCVIDSEDDYLVHADDFSAQPAPIKWLIKGWLQDLGLSMVHRPSGGGKTFVVLDWCLHIASDKQLWAGLKVKNGDVVYLAGEGHHGLKGRVAAWKHANGVNKLNMWLSKAGVDLNTSAGYLRVKKAIDALPGKPKLIVVDTLHRFLSGDENSSEDAKTMLDACAGLMREYECSVLLVHHTGVSEETQHRARGSSAWKGALENEISIVPAKEKKPLEIAARKTKDAEMPKSIFAQLSSVSIPGWIDEDGEQVTSAIVSICDAPVVEEEYLKEKASLTNARKYFEAAVMSVGRPENGLPFISADAWNGYSASREHATDGARRTALSSAKKELLAAMYIMEKDGGYSPTPESMSGVFAGAFIGLRPY